MDPSSGRRLFFRRFLERVFKTDQELSDLKKAKDKTLIQNLAKAAIHLWNEMLEDSPFLQVPNSGHHLMVSLWTEIAFSARDDAKR